VGKVVQYVKDPKKMGVATLLGGAGGLLGSYGGTVLDALKAAVGVF
jgi:hypothetical protein